MREMKDSGIAWIGAMPRAWKMNTIAQIFLQVKCKNTGLQEKNLLSLSYGKVKRKSIDTVEGLLPESFDGYNIIEKDDIVLRLTDLQNDHTSLRVGLAEERGIITSAYLTIRNRSNFCPKYLYYYLHSFDIAKGFYGMGAGVRQGLNWDGVKWLKILAPSVPEQERIAAFLDAECAEIDAVLEKTRASIEEYKKLKQAIITQAVTKGIRGDMPMKDSGIEWIGEISQDFEIVKLKWLCDVLDQFRSPVTADKRNQNADVLYDYYGASGAIDKIDGYTIDDHVMLIGEDGANLRMRNLPIMYEINGKAWVNNHAHILKPKAGVDFYFIFYALEALDLNYYITGSAQPKLSQDNLRNILVPITDFIGQKRIAAYISDVCDEFDCLIAKKQQYLTEIENYKKSLIYEYVTGKRRCIRCDDSFKCC